MFNLFGKSNGFKELNDTPVNITVTGDLQEFKDKHATDLVLISHLQKDFQLLLSTGELEAFITKDVKISVIDEQMSRALLPDQKRAYINIMASLRLMRLKKKDGKEHEQAAKSLFSSMVEDSGSDIIDELISNLSKNNFETAIQTKKDVFYIAGDGRGLVHRISDGMLEETTEDKLKDQIVKIQEQKEAVIRMTSFFDIIMGLSGIIEIN